MWSFHNWFLYWPQKYYVTLSALTLMYGRVEILGSIGFKVFLQGYQKIYVLRE